MTAPLQPQFPPGDHQYFDWSISKQQTNLLHPLMTNTHRRNYYYQHYEDNQLQQNKTTTTTRSPLSLSPTSHMKKKQKFNQSNDEFNHSQSCYPFQAELTQKIDIECDGGNQIIYPPTHHFTLSTVINVSVNAQTQKSLDILSSPSQQQHPIKSHEYLPPSSSPLISYSELNFSSYLKDIDLTTLDTFTLPSCPNPQDYLTVEGLLTFLMSDKHVPKQSPTSRHPYQQYPYYDYPKATSNPMETATSLYYRQSSFPQQMIKYHSTVTPTSSFR